MRFIRSLALILAVLFVVQTPSWAQTVSNGPEIETITPRPDETYWTPKRMREAKPMPMPSIPENYRHYRKGPRTTAITPRSDETYWTPKRMREAKPMPMPSIPGGVRPD
jgi:hypothetical protein